MANIYDGVFCTILNDCQKQIILVINKIFGEAPTGKEEIQFFLNEQFIFKKRFADADSILHFFM